MIRIFVLALAIYGVCVGYERVVHGVPACIPAFMPTTALKSGGTL
jgi:hypothetical protein